MPECLKQEMQNIYQTLPHLGFSETEKYFIVGLNIMQM